MAKIGFVLLCGGKSSRMGKTKALLEVNGKRLLETVAQAGEGFAERILSVNDPAIPTPEGFVRIEDVYPGCGPMAGIHAALAATTCDALVTAPCDAPYYSRALAEVLAQAYDPAENAVMLVGRDGRDQPLCGIYAKSCLPVLEAHLRAGRFKMMRMLEEMNVRRMALPEHIEERVFENLNTPQDIQEFVNKNG